MKKLSLIVVSAIVMMGVTFTSCNSKNATGSVKLKTDLDSVSYMMGKVQGSNSRKQMEEQVEKQWPAKGNFDAFIAGFMNGINNAEDTLLLGKSFQEAGEFVNAVFAKAQEEQLAANKAEADKFLAENMKKSGVFTTESGLQYKVITEGKGAKPKDGDIVKFHYHGTFLDGGVFDSTTQRGEPFQYALDQLPLEGWKEGIKLMPVGSKYIFWIPIELGFFNIPNSPLNNKFLIFELELVEIVKQ